jgi:hypothetical protein
MVISRRYPRSRGLGSKAYAAVSIVLFCLGFISGKGANGVKQYHHSMPINCQIAH